MLQRLSSVLLTLCLLATAALGFEADPDLTPAEPSTTRLLRMPDIAGDRVTFVYGGDLWVVDRKGGAADRLTSHEGLELFPKLSPDGSTVAFSAEYNGNRQIYTLPLAGGAVRQLTWYNDVGPMPPRGGWDYRVLDWTPDGDRVLFLGNRLPWGPRMSKPFTIPAAGGMPEPLGPPESGGGMLSPDGSHFVYTPISREFRTWKRYRGGRAQDVWTWNIAEKTATRRTDFVGTDNQPLWVGDTIYFTSDRSGTLNLWALPPGAEQAEQVTFHGAWDVLWPSAGADAIVYEAGGWIWLFEPETRQTQRIPITVRGDFPSAQPQWRDLSDQVTSASISPSGRRVAIEARGELFSTPAEKGESRNLTRTPGVRERDPAWSPDGRTIAYWSDATGEYELWLRPADGSGPARQITRDGATDPTWRSAARWSPDGTRLAFADRRARLRVVEVETGELIDVDRDSTRDFAHYRWSPDSRWLAYSKTGESQLESLWVWQAERNQRLRLTSDATHDTEPVWGRDGELLYFLSNRDFNLTLSGYEFDFLYTDPTRIYFATLHSAIDPPLTPESDEEDGPKTEADEKNPWGKDKSRLVRVEAEGFERRVRAIPGNSGQYASLVGLKGGVAYLATQDGATSLRRYDFEKREELTLVDGASGFELAAGGEKLLVLAGGDIGVFGLSPGATMSEQRLDLTGVAGRVAPRVEWPQLFTDAWRIARDWFYDPAMHGLDWDSMREKYEPLVAHAQHRSDLDYIFGELVGELNAGHAYVQTSNDWQVERHESGLLGAEIVADEASGAFVVEKIFEGENWHERLRSPLTEPGVDVRPGDLILAVDGFPTRGVENFYQLLEGRADRVVELRVQSGDGPERVERVRPIRSETSLRYRDWVEERRRRVDELSGGRIGYIHLPNTAVEGNRELFRGLYGQSRKEALLLDARYNGGGFIPFQMIELLQRPLLSYWARREIQPFSTPAFFNPGPKAVLINGYSSSGGDAFPYYFRQQGLGQLIGTRTWGGLIGVSGNPSLMDGATVLLPVFRFLDPAGHWAVENEGVSPDIEVLDHPELVAAGQDPTLEAGVRHLLEQLAAAPPVELTVPAPPDETAAPGAD